jgi:uncharacterized 2Fe-2S/4Fe-4S cluster protein (DUF4445 family)
MPNIECYPSRKVISVPPGTELLAALRAAGLEVDAPCGGKGTCGKCIVRVTRGDVDSSSLGTLPATAVAEGFVLACRTRVLQTDLVVEVPEPSPALVSHGGKFSDSDETHLVRTELLPKDADFDPLAVKWLLIVPPPQLESGLSDIDRLSRALQRDWGKLRVSYPLAVLRAAAQAVRARDGLVTVTLVRESDRIHVIRLEPGDTTTRHFGLAVDVGTTTVAVQLIDLTCARILATRTDYNGQIACGLDVISRINYARRPERLEELRTRVLETINRLVQQAAAQNEVDPREICNAVISGNTTMTHLLLGLNPEQIRLHPYTPTVLEPPYLDAGAIGLAIDPDSWVCFSPCVGSYVGGDITAGILCTDLATATEDLSLFVDIGTNGELVIGNRDFLVTTACSAGPAFEGAGIECGMRAAVGAIEKIDVDPATGSARYTTIGNAPPKGICGSGMIDLLANLYRTGWLDAGGKFDRSRPSPAIDSTGRRARYLIAPPEAAAEGVGPIAISEVDIENIVRAKAAIYSACALLLHQLELDFSDLANVYIAGGFGRFLDLEQAITIGLLPDIARAKFHYIGNSSLLGSFMVAVSQRFRRRQLDLAARMTCVELSTDPAYMDEYTAALFLPHTDPARFPSVRPTVLQSATATGAETR